MLNPSLNKSDIKYLVKFIRYLERTSFNDWCVGKVRTADGKNCVLGHVVAYSNNDITYWDYFEQTFATEYILYPINDGKNIKYQQSSAKNRIIAFLKNLLFNQEKTTEQWGDYHLKIYLENKMN